MKFDFESLSTEPLFYMLMHSGAFVCVLGFIFFVVGLLFGYATWGRYKRQTRQLLGEAHAMKDEIANLKRKVGDHSVLSGPAIAMATETIHMPKKEGTTAADAVPAVTAETITTRDIRLSATAPQPAVPPAAPTAPAGAQTPEPLSAVPSSAELTKASITLSTAELPPPARHASPLAAIITPHVKEEPVAGEGAHSTTEGLVPADILPALTELLLPALPELEAQPQLELNLDSELDPKLGLIYKTPPEKKDDLTALRGIAKVLEKRLHEFGIYTYAQIAAWDEDHIREFSARLAFKDRIHREHWVEQARQLVARQMAAV